MRIDLLFWISIILNIVFILKTILNRIKYVKLKQLYYDQVDLANYSKNKLSMIEYHYRQFKEGKNPFTVLRDINNVLYGIHKNKYDVEK